MPRFRSERASEAGRRVRDLKSRLESSLRSFLVGNWPEHGSDHNDWVQELWLRLLETHLHGEGPARGSKREEKHAYRTLRNIASETVRTRERRARKRREVGQGNMHNDSASDGQLLSDEHAWVLATVLAWVAEPPAELGRDSSVRLATFAHVLKRAGGWPRTKDVAAALAVSTGCASKFVTKLRKALQRERERERERERADER